MVDSGHPFRRALSRLPSWLPANFVSVDHAALQTPKEFSSTDHLSAEAVAAFVDGELPMKAHMRAAGHLSACSQCAGEVDAQGQARAALRDSRPVTMPTSLMGLLSAIPESAPEDPPTPPVSEQRSDGGVPRVRRKRR